MEVVEREVYMLHQSSPISLISKFGKREYNACVCGILEMEKGTTLHRGSIKHSLDMTKSRPREKMKCVFVSYIFIVMIL